MRVTVTGATGHLGNVLVRALLEQGHEVRASATQRRRSLDGLDVDFQAADLRDPEAVRRVIRGAQRVFHCGALISLFEADAAQMREINVGGVAHVLAACAAEGVERLIHFSSVHAFAPQDGVIDERSPLALARGLPAYDRTKAEATSLVRAAPVDAVVLHPTAVLGPMDFMPGPIGGQLWRMARGQMPVSIEGGFDWIDVRDVAAGALAAAEHGRKGQSYLLTGAWRSLKDLARDVARLRGTSGPWLELPQWVVRPVAPLCDALAWCSSWRPPFNSTALFALRHHRHLSGARARAELCFEARPLDQSLADTLSWFEQDRR